MGRARKPLALQKGNLTVIQQDRRTQEEKAATGRREDIFRPPDWLIDDVARDEYIRILENLKMIQMICDLDLNNLAAYCNAYSNYRKVTEQLAGQDFYITRETRTGVIVVENPLIKIQTNYANEMRKFGALCGLTIDSRLKQSATKVNQTEQDIQKKFGMI